MFTILCELFQVVKDIIADMFPLWCVDHEDDGEDVSTNRTLPTLHKTIFLTTDEKTLTNGLLEEQEA